MFTWRGRNLYLPVRLHLWQPGAEDKKKASEIFMDLAGSGAGAGRVRRRGLAPVRAGF
jgi:hypothetical protein